jgi:hypothetical protein
MLTPKETVVVAVEPLQVTFTTASLSVALPVIVAVAIPPDVTVVV